MFEYRVTKYDPALRDGDGAYRRDEWTSFTHVGKRFEGHLLTPETYARTEDDYLAAVSSFLDEAVIAHLSIVDLENRGGYNDPSLDLREGAEVDRSQIPEVVRGLLREAFWCRLEGSEGAFVHVGWD